MVPANPRYLQFLGAFCEHIRCMNTPSNRITNRFLAPALEADAIQFGADNHRLVHVEIELDPDILARKAHEWATLAVASIMRRSLLNLAAQLVAQAKTVK